MFNINKISDLLKEKRISKRELSKNIDKNENTIQNYLSGKTKIEVEILEKISKFLEVPIFYFFDDIDINTVTPKKADSPEITILKNEIDSLKEQLKLKDEIIELLKRK